ncbi:MAG: hypothetical protein H6698_09600 [Myxococcales bacterium]|nr:hypothetical protein [Myxococcales bacterium]MCB9532634.1 hypothetical protein [Myxococcales bacterium]MCB9534536.1 hypothetical protein [Myxococcales bacterium]
MSTTAYDFSINRHQLNLPLVANATKKVVYTAGRDEKILGISLLAMAAPTSASGTALFTAGKGAAAGTNLLGSTNFSIETLTDGVRSEMTLTATTADLNLSEGDTVEFKVVSNNADMVVTGDNLGILLETVAR